MKKVVLSLLFLVVIAVTNVFATQADVYSDTGLNSAIGNIAVTTITVFNDIDMNVNISTINARELTIDTDGPDYFITGNDNTRRGFYITNSTVSINNINLSNFKSSVSVNINSTAAGYARSSGSALYVNRSTILYKGNNILIENNISSASIVNANTGSGFASVFGGAVYLSGNRYQYSMVDFAFDTCVSFDSSGDITFFNNTAAGYGTAPASLPLAYASGTGAGGAICSMTSSFSFVSSGDISFLSNTAFGYGYGSASGSGNGWASGNASGGAIYTDNSMIFFVSSGSINFLNNTAFGTASRFGSGSIGGNGQGGAICGSRSTYSFVSYRDINFTSNTVSCYGSAQGGAIYAGSMYAEFSFVSHGDINFSSNIAFSFGPIGISNGGAIAGDPNTALSFVSYGGINFLNNISSASSMGYGGAVYSQSSSFSFTSAKDIIFLNNMNSGLNVAYGGAIYNNASLYFSIVSSGNVDFISNIANGTANTDSFGGAIYNNASLYFSIVSSGDINFLDNAARGPGSGNIYNACYGGAIYSQASSFSFVSSGNIKFINNSAMASGSGYGYGDGGAIYSDNASNFYFVSLEDINFLNNTASGFADSGSGNGGAIYSNSSSGYGIFNFIADKISFEGNLATATTIGAGGAIYLQQTTITFNANSIEFVNNTASHLGGAIFASKGSAINFNAAGGDMSVSFEDNYANEISNDVYLSSAYYSPGYSGIFKYYGASATLNFNALNGNIILTNGIKIDGDGSGTVNKTGAGSFILGGNTIIKNNAFNITDGDVIFLDNAIFTGPNMIVPMGNILDMQNETVNIMTVGVFSSITDTKIDVWANGDHDQIISGEATVGGNLDINARVGKYNKKTYTIIVSSLAYVQGLFVSTSCNLPLLATLNDYNNANAVILTLNGVYASDFSSRTYSRRGHNHIHTARILDDLSIDDIISDDMADIITELMTRSDREVEDTLLSMSGYFLPNVLRSIAGAPANEIYDKIRNHAREDRTNSGLWAQVRGEIAKFAENINSPQDYKDSSLGLMIGFDRYIADNGLMWGAYGRFNSHNIEQGNNKADGTNKGLGVYGGLIKADWELKALISGSFDNFDTKRYVYTPLGNRTAIGEIESFTLSGDIEAALKYAMSEKMKFRPYVGVEIDDVNYKGFTESGAGAVNLEVKGGNYIRSAARLGAGIEYDKTEWSVYARAEGKYLMTGFEPEVESRFEGTNTHFTTKGTEEGKLQIGLGLGGEMFVSENWKLFANANYYTAERYSNMYGNVGVRYVFGIRTSKPEKKAEAKEEKMSSSDEIQTATERALAEANETGREEIEAFKEKEKSGEIELIKAEDKTDVTGFRLTQAFFEFDKYDLTPEAEEAVAGLGRILKEMDYSSIKIDGHTDDIGTHEYNMELSDRRANTVYEKLLEMGINSDKIEKAGHGFTKPIATNETEEGRALNRRVEIIVE
ncbi:MAG: autotransporter domain-containing protein [Endomicrobia bacterium]|nr:autotransporter domain-containing protein [Endomicrobiia bacterium]MCL2507140.1 autotransporter domain-containing protein [Endomicrobiia bacterium]